MFLSKRTIVCLRNGELKNNRFDVWNTGCAFGCIWQQTWFLSLDAPLTVGDAEITCATNRADSRALGFCTYPVAGGSQKYRERRRPERRKTGDILGRKLRKSPKKSTP